MVVALVLSSCAAPAEEEEAKTIIGKVTEKEAPEEEEEEVVVAPKKEGPTYGGTLTIIRNTPLTAFDEGFGFPWATQALSYTNEELFSGNWALGLSGTKEVTFQTWGISGLTGAEPRLCESYEVTFEDDTGLIETTFFPKAYRRFCSILYGNRPFILYGRVEEDFGAVTMTVNRLERVGD